MSWSFVVKRSHESTRSNTKSNTDYGAGIQNFFREISEFSKEFGDAIH